MRGKNVIELPSNVVKRLNGNNTLFVVHRFRNYYKLDRHSKLTCDVFGERINGEQLKKKKIPFSSSSRTINVIDEMPVRKSVKTGGIREY